MTISLHLIEKVSSGYLRKAKQTHAPIDIVQVAYSAGFKVFGFEPKDGSTVIEGMTHRFTNETRIYVRSDLSAEWKRFVLARELGAIIADAEKLSTADSSFSDEFALYRQEMEAGEPSEPRPEMLLALALLMPANELEALHKRTGNISILAQLFAVPEQIVPYRLNILDLLRVENG